MVHVVTLPVAMALSWAAAQPALAQQATQQHAGRAAAETIICPLTGAPIPSCCCPVKVQK